VQNIIRLQDGEENHFDFVRQSQCFHQQEN